MSKGGGPVCPKCGGDSGYTVNDRAWGWVQYLGDWTGDEERTNGEDGLFYSRSKYVRCEDCGARIARPADRTSTALGGGG